MTGETVLNSDLPFSEVTIHRRAVKRVTLKVRESGKVEMVGPRRVSNAEFKQFYLSKQNWVTKQRQSLLAAQANKPRLEEHQMLLHGDVIPRRPANSDAKDKATEYRLYAKQYLNQRLAELSVQTGLRFARLTIRAQRTRWGSCSNKGNISLNWRLVQMPEYVSDYIMIHELCHTQHMNHSQAFWNLVSQHCTQMNEARLWLKTHGSALPD